MRKSIRINYSAFTAAAILFALISLSFRSQDQSGQSSPLPENVEKFVSSSCMPCHSSTGGLLSRSKLNFDQWKNYSSDKQQKLASEMYKEVKKDAMPPKSARENNPSIIPTNDQKELLKAWSQSLSAEGAGK
jgi:hypothetical protein